MRQLYKKTVTWIKKVEGVGLEKEIEFGETCRSTSAKMAYEEEG